MFNEYCKESVDILRKMWYNGTTQAPLKNRLLYGLLWVVTPTVKSPINFKRYLLKLQQSIRQRSLFANDEEANPTKASNV